VVAGAIAARPCAGLAIIYGRSSNPRWAGQDRALPGAAWADRSRSVAFLERRRRRVQRSASDVAGRSRHALIYSRPSRNANCCSGQEHRTYFRCVLQQSSKSPLYRCSYHFLSPHGSSNADIKSVARLFGTHIQLDIMNSDKTYQSC